MSRLSLLEVYSYRRVSDAERAIDAIVAIREHWERCDECGDEVAYCGAAMDLLDQALNAAVDYRKEHPILLILCGACGETIPLKEACVLPGNPTQGIPAEARCARCMGEEAPRG